MIKKLSFDETDETHLITTPIHWKYTMITASWEFKILTPDVTLIKANILTSKAVLFPEWEDRREDDENI